MAEQPLRKLAALLHADVVGSTPLVRLNETLAHERIQDTFRRFSETISTHGGAAHEIRGDAIVAEFSKASDAVSASLAFQSANLTHNEKLTDEIRPVVRIGIALGEVVVADNAVTGEGVVLAQRLEQLAEPGGVCIQGAAYETVPKRLPFKYESLGEQKLKGFDEPVRAYRVARQSEVSVVAPLPALGDAPTVVPSVAVLPFIAIGGEAEELADGLTENIINTLSRTGQCRVSDQSSTFFYKGRTLRPGEVADELGVEHVIQGSVRRSGNRVRITAEVFATNTQQHIWSQRFDRTLDDEFDLQDEVARSVTQAVRVVIVHGAAGRAWEKSSDNFEAWVVNLQGVELTGKGSREDNHQARKLFEQVVELDPSYFWGPSNIAFTHWVDCTWGWSNDTEHALDEAMKFGQLASELEPNDPHPYAALGHVAMYRGDYARARELAEKVVNLGKDDPFAGLLASQIYCLLGDVERARILTLKSFRESPGLPAYIVWFNFEFLGLCHLVARRYQEALTALDRAIDLALDSAFPHALKAVAYHELDQTEQASVEMQQALELRPELILRHFHYYLAFRDLAHRERFARALAESGLPE